MACCATTPEQKEAKARNKVIESQLRKDKQNYRIKLLLLGAGESGKSTIAKQMKIIHLNGYNKDEERLRFRQFVFSNVFDNMIALIEAANSFGYSLSGANKEAANRIIAMQDDYKSADAKTLPKDIADDFKKLWADNAIQQAYIRSSEFQLGDSCEYFFSSLDRIAEENFIPTVADILRVRTKTTGINEIEFSIGKYNFRMTDVGGQRSERRKWIHCFEDVTAIIFCAALSEYDQKLYEDQTVNRMLEAIKLFSDTTNSRWFHETPIILFLNKADLFEKKITKVPLNVCFKNYTGPNTPKEASEFIEKQFTSQIRNPNKLVYVYKTTATDTSNVKFVFRAVKDIFITAYLNHLGIGIGPGGPAPGLPSAPPPTKTERSESTERADNGKQEA